MSDLESIKGPESFQVPERPHSTLTNYKNLAYNILKNLNDELVKDKEILELRPFSECTMKVLTLLLKAITILLCMCPFPKCGKKAEIIYPFTRRNSQSSQSSRTSAISNLMGEKFVLNSLVILEDPMEKVVKNALIQETEIGTYAKCSKKITLGFPKDTVFLSCKHAVHFNCIDNSNKRCPTCPVNLQLILTTQRRRTSNSFTEKTSRKKAKPLGRDNSPILKRLIQELLTNDSEDDISLQ
ncbi:uncharacterized protein OCT59_014040 [Rhizophagus irregularis]|uniref:Zinc finger C3HC4 RING-type domain-containing protein n=2 Tax=Rhizophagus irregularis TaxID=588596 RepID=A0A015L5Q7_RHIIW|nr:hypothetical protein RirG_045790 [Rhizophagus irregularis DAOM 197198w]UZO21653.1 hypothetical protein OCT59_014040 [Rhizophagus irregularis]GBC23036.2 hypothetical protein GLOIN_2v1474272 [Rhizophagus irregularis DAOM 181602=DAOM 197198]